MGNFQKVISQIELFIKKYYTNQIIKGGILFLGVLLLSYLAVSTLEYVGRFGSGVRFFLLASFIGVNVFLLGKFLIIPLLKLNRLGKHLSIFDASTMIGKIFPEISDKLKNTLQLHKDRQDISLNLELVNASIEQRASKLSVVSFSSGIDLTENRKYLRYLAPVVLLFTVIAIANPQLFTDGTERIVYFNEEFVEEAPFEFVLLSSEEVKEGEDYMLEMKLVGEEIPSELKVKSNVGTYNLQQKSKIEFRHNFSNLNENLTFVCEANGYTSQQFDVKVLRKPVIESINLQVVYPKHTNRKSERFDNTGDITVPEGSTIEWNIAAKNLTELNAFFGDTAMSLNTSLSNSYTFKNQFFKSQEYLLTVSSKEIENADSLNYNVGVVKDEYPTISITEEIDSTNNLKRFIEGTIGDDYGFRNLSAVVNVSGKDTAYKVVKPIGIKSGLTQQIFSFFIDISTFELAPGDRVEYSFVVTDNDELNGYKSSSSAKQIFAVPEIDELDNILSEKDDQMKNEMDQALSDANELKKKIKDIKSNMVNKPSLDWKDKRNMEDLMKMQMDLTQKIDELKKDFEKNQVEKENFMDPSEELLEKQELLEKLLEELMDDEFRELMEELQKLMDEMNKEDLLENMEDMEMEMESMEEELDRALELFKNMELDQKLENLQEQLEELAEKQDELQQETEDKKSEMSQEELQEEQKKIDDAFEEIKKDIDEIEEKNAELEKPREMEFDEETEQETEESLEDAQEQLDDNKNKKASESQSKASDGMKKMAEQASSMQAQMQAQQQTEDMDALRYLLENLVTLSQDQEGLMDEYGMTKTSDPYYLELNRKQLDIDRNTEIVNDSLVALSKRVFQLSSFITEELQELDYNLGKSLIYSEERNTGILKQHQQYTMTGYNDLALMLSEVLAQMQQQAGQQSGSGSCNNPGGKGKGKSKSGMSMQQMKDAMKEQIGKMKGGKKPGGEKGKGQKGKNGEQMGDGSPGMIPGLSPKEIAKMAAQQSQIRESLKKMRQDLNKDGTGAGNGLNDLIEDIDKMEEDLLNGRVGTDYIRRQEDILTRLLEHEKAVRERGYSEERESQEGKNKEEGNLIKFTEYNRKKNAEVEFLRSLPVELRVYYKTLVNEYFNSVND